MLDVGVCTRVGNTSVCFGEKLRTTEQLEKLDRTEYLTQAGKVTAVGVGAVGMLSTAALAVTLGPAVAAGALGSSVALLVARDLYVCSDNMQEKIDRIRTRLFGFAIGVNSAEEERARFLHGTVLVGPAIDGAEAAVHHTQHYARRASEEAQRLANAASVHAHNFADYVQDQASVLSQRAHRLV